jgi:malonate decarboxylase delta subunit
MEKFTRNYAAGAPAPRRALAGVVGSGDLEVLVEPARGASTSITVHTSVDGKEAVWNAVLERMFGGADLPAVDIEINDCGATPGVVRMRLEEAMEEARKP